ncbi:MAG: hypothetical protein AABW90_02040 [Nanoarchaeota archaeon]
MKKRGNSPLNSVINLLKLPESKSSQTTIFIILAILIAGAITGSVYFINENKKTASLEFFSSSDVQPVLKNIQTKILDCSEETSKKSLEKIGVQGGHYNKPRYYFDMKSNFIPYYYYEGQILMPSKSTIENELSGYVNENLDKCLQNNYQNFEITFKKPKTKTTIKEKDVNFLINLPIKIEKDNHDITFELKEHPITISSELDAILGVANFITETHKDDPAMYCVSCVGKLAEEDNLYVDILKFRNNEMLVIISENHTSSEPYSFEFLNKYTGKEASPLTILNETAPKPG